MDTGVSKMEKKKNLGGRPRKEIDKQTFENLCALQCTESEICSWFDTTDKTLSKWCKETYGLGFSDIYPIKAEGGKISLRRTQWKLAQKSPAMAIFLGKNMLGQTDKVQNVTDMHIENVNPPEVKIYLPDNNRNDADLSTVKRQTEEKA